MKDIFRHKIKNFKYILELSKLREKGLLKVFKVKVIIRQVNFVI